jgi:hypothetical protein
MRLLTTIFAAVCSLLLIFVVFFWVRSYFYYEGTVWFRPGGEVRVALTVRGQRGEGQIPAGRMRGFLSRRGSLTFASIADPTDEPPSESWSHPVDQPPGKGAMTLMFPTLASGFRVGSGISKVSDADLQWELPFWRISAPYWIVVILLGIAPFRWVRAFREAGRREAAGLCVRCGQSVQGLSGVCPKCGTPIPT